MEISYAAFKYDQTTKDLIVLYPSLYVGNNTVQKFIPIALLVLATVTLVGSSFGMASVLAKKAETSSFNDVTKAVIKTESQTLILNLNSIPGKDGKDGKNGINGTDGRDGKDGITTVFVCGPNDNRTECNPPVTNGTNPTPVPPVNNTNSTVR